MKLSRRCFLQSSLAATALPLAAGLPAAVSVPKPGTPAGASGPPAADSAGLTAYQAGPQVWIRWNNLLLTSYRAHGTQKYPYMFPVAGPLTGLSLTTETGLPWPHHRSLFFGSDRVNGGDYWAGELATGHLRSTGLKLGGTTKDTVRILDACEWLKPGQPPVMTDQRKITVTLAGARLRFIEWEIQWTAVQDVTIPKTNHSLFSLRAAPDLAPSGGGTLVNAEGASGEKATFGKKSAWCGYSGQRAGRPDGLVEGIALMDHPKNPWAPCPWFTRDYGFISPTPLFFLDQPWELAAGKSVTLRYRVVLHAGDAQEAGVATIFKEWAAKEG